MNPALAELAEWAPAFALVLARVGAAMALLPGLGESVAPARVRIGLAFCITILLLPDVQPMMPPVPAAGLSLGLMVAGEAITGLWFGWLTRMIVLALPMCAQFIGYLIGLSSVLQPDTELGAQSTALGKLFELAAPVLLLVTGLYRLPLLALTKLFQLIPPGQMLPFADSAEMAIHAVSTAFGVAVQVASPFVVIGVVWHVAMGLIARIVSRMQNLLCIDAGTDNGGDSFADDERQRDDPCLDRRNPGLFRGASRRRLIDGRGRRVRRGQDRGGDPTTSGSGAR